MLEGICRTDRRLLEMARVFRVPLGRRLRGIYLPQVMPYFRTVSYTHLPLGGIIVILEIMSVMDALPVKVPLPSHELDTALGGVARQQMCIRDRA